MTRTKEEAIQQLWDSTVMLDYDAISWGQYKNANYEFDFSELTWKREMVMVGSEWIQGHPELSLTLKPYREHRARIKATMQIIQTVSDIFTLQHMTEADYKEI